MLKKLQIIFLVLVLIISSVSAQSFDPRYLLGKSVNSQEFKDFANTLPSRDVEIVETAFSARVIEFRKDGVNIYAAGDGEIMWLNLFKLNNEGYGDFKGFIPYYLTVNDTKKEIASKIGSPSRVMNDDKYTNLFWDDIGVTITYLNTSIAQGIDQLYDITIRPPIEDWESEKEEIVNSLTDLLIKEQGN